MPSNGTILLPEIPTAPGNVTLDSQFNVTVGKEYRRLRGNGVPNHRWGACRAKGTRLGTAPASGACHCRTLPAPGASRHACVHARVHRARRCNGATRAPGPPPPPARCSIGVFPIESGSEAYDIYSQMPADVRRCCQCAGGRRPAAGAAPVLPSCLLPCPPAPRRPAGNGHQWAGDGAGAEQGCPPNRTQGYMNAAAIPVKPYELDWTLPKDPLPDSVPTCVYDLAVGVALTGAV